MFAHKFRCRWCRKLYITPTNYSNHIKRKHPEHAHTLSSKISHIISIPLPADSPTDGLQSIPDGKDTSDPFTSKLASEEDFNNCFTILDYNHTDRDPMGSNSDDEEIYLETFEEEGPDGEKDAEADGLRQALARLKPGRVVAIKRLDALRHPGYNHLHPFKSPLDYKLARFFNGSRIAMTKIDEFFKDGLLDISRHLRAGTVSFKSAYTLNQKIQQMIIDPPWMQKTVDYTLQPGTVFYYRNVLECIQYLLRQRSFAEHMVWAPNFEYNASGERTYADLYTADWWHTRQKMLPVGSTLIPVLFASDQTHLTNFSGDKKLWPWYISLGNIKAEIRNKPNFHAWIPLALLPVPPKRVTKLPGHSTDEQEKESTQIFHEVISDVLSPITDGSGQEGFEMFCADESIRLCFPVICAWLADHMENANLHCININRCPTCTARPDELGLISDEKLPPREHMVYAQALQYGDKDVLIQDGVKAINNALWHVDVEPRDLVRGDLLHNIYLGVLKHLMDWIHDFLDENRRLHIFDEVWKQLPPYPGFTPPQKAYRAVSQWTGKEMRNLGRVILAALTATLRRKTDVSRPNTDQQRDFERAISCVRHLTDFHLYAQYRRHTDATVKYMANSLRLFHQTKDVFLQYRAGKTVRKEAKDAIRLMSDRQRETFATNRPNMTPAARKRQLERDQKERAIHLQELLEEKAHYNIPKIHLLSHYADQIPLFGSLTQYSTEICEASHKPLKDAYRRSNHVEATPQIISRYARDHNFHMHTQNLRSWASALDSMPSEIKAIVGVQADSGGNLTADVGNASVGNLTANVENASVENPNADVKKAPAAPAKNYVQLKGRIDMSKIQSVKDLMRTHHLHDLQQLLSVRFRHLPDPDRQIADSTVECFQSLIIPVPNFQGEEVNSHVARSTGPFLFRNRQPRADWVWVKRREPSDELRGSLNGKIPAKLNALFKLRTVGHGVHLLAHVSLTEAYAGNRPIGPEGMVRVQLVTENNILVNIRDITSIAHLVPLEQSTTGMRWLVNNRIDFDTWNDIYDDIY